MESRGKGSSPSQVRRVQPAHSQTFRPQQGAGQGSSVVWEVLGAGCQKAIKAKEGEGMIPLKGKREKSLTLSSKGSLASNLHPPQEVFSPPRNTRVSPQRERTWKFLENLGRALGQQRLLMQGPPNVSGGTKCPCLGHQMWCLQIRWGLPDGGQPDLGKAGGQAVKEFT